MSALDSKSPLTAPKTGIDARVGREMAREYGWLMRRTKRNEELIALPEVMSMADELARHMERWAFVEDVEMGEVEVTVLPTRSKKYITIAFGARECHACQGVGQVGVGTAQATCSTCDGTGVR